MIHRMLSGALPFDGPDSFAVFLAHLNETPHPLTSPLGVLPPRVVRLVSRALAKSPGERHQTMREMIVDIDDAQKSLGAADWRRWLP